MGTEEKYQFKAGELTMLLSDFKKMDIAPEGFFPTFKEGYRLAITRTMGFAEWVGGRWLKNPDEEDLWSLPSEDFDTPPEEKTTDQLFTLFLQHINLK